MQHRILCCGNRNWSNYTIILEELKIFPSGTIIIEGEAKGADKLSAKAANELGFTVLKYPAKWAIYGKAAGPIRNKQMLNEGKPTLVIAFHNDIASSKGTKDMVNQARKAGLSVKIVNEVKISSPLAIFTSADESQ